MKKVISLFMTLLMVLSALQCLSVVSFAAERSTVTAQTNMLQASKSVKSISFSPIKEYVLYKELNQYDDWGITGERIYVTPAFNVGDKLTVTYSDSKSVVYTFKEDSGHVGYFISSDGSKINDFDIEKGNVDEKESYFTLSYQGKSCKVPVTILENPIKSISATYKYDICKPDDVSFSDWNTDVNLDKTIIGEYIICSLVLKDGTTFTGTCEEVYKKFGVSVAYQIQLTTIGKNKGKCWLSCWNNDIMEGDFVVNVQKTPSNSPSCIFKTYALNFVKGQTVDFQLIQFADKGYTHYINVFEIPNGLKLSNNGKITGTAKESGSLRFDVRWKNSSFHVYNYYGICVYICEKSKVVKIPSKFTKLDYNKTIDINASKNNPKWLRFRACDYSTGIGTIEKNIEQYNNGMEYSVYDSKGIPIEAEGYGDSNYGLEGDYYCTYGDYYYIKVISSGKLTIRHYDDFKPEWTSSNNNAEDTTKLTKTNYKKTFSGDSNILWNVYSFESTIKKDFKDDFTWEKIATMRRFASPVNIHMQTSGKSNLDMIGSYSYTFDPNNKTECETIGVSTNQNTLKKQLKKGEKEYRFDTIYYLMPKIGQLTLEETSLLYVPSCYKLDSKNLHVVKKSGHKSTAKKTKATTTKDGKIVYHCDACKADVKAVTIAKVSSIKLSASKYAYDGKTKTPSVTVKDSKGTTLRNGTDYTVKYSSGRKTIGQYTVTVTFKGNYSGTKKLSFTIAPKAPTLKVTAGSKKAVLSWNKQTGASGYVVYMSTSKNGKYSKVATVKGNSKTSYTKTDLTKGKTYYFKVAAYTVANGKTLYSSFSSVKAVKIK